MSSHCHCDDPDPVVREQTITQGVPEPTTNRVRECADCWGLIEVLG